MCHLLTLSLPRGSPLTSVRQSKIYNCQWHFNTGVKGLKCCSFGAYSHLFNCMPAEVCTACLNFNKLAALKLNVTRVHFHIKQMLVAFVFLSLSLFLFSL